MQDFVTVAVAFITALSTLAAGGITLFFQYKTENRREERDETQLMREQVSILYQEIESIYEQSFRASSNIWNALQSKTVENPQDNFINTGKIRALVSLYFPTLQIHVDEFDKLEEQNLAEFRKNLNEQKLDAKSATLVSVTQRSANVGQLKKGLRAGLTEIAKDLGAKSLLGSRSNNAPRGQFRIP